MWVLTPRMDLISAIFLSTYFFPIGSTSAISLGDNPSSNNLSTSPLRPLSNWVRIDSFEAVLSKLIAVWRRGAMHLSPCLIRSMA